MPERRLPLDAGKTMSNISDLFVFAIPLIPKHRAKNWQRVLDNLQATLQSILNQTDQNFMVLLAAGDEIDLPETNHMRVAVLNLQGDAQTNHNAEIYGASISDMNMKRGFMENEAKRIGARFLMHADADDLLSNRLVEFVRSTNHPNGYALTRGFVMNYASGKILPCPSEAIPVASFDDYCGTSIIYNMGDKPSDWENVIGIQGHHKARFLAKNAGNPLLEIDQRMAIYVLNAGENISMYSKTKSRSPDFAYYVLEGIEKHGSPMTKSQQLEFGLFFDNSLWLR